MATASMQDGHETADGHMDVPTRAIVWVTKPGRPDRYSSCEGWILSAEGALARELDEVGADLDQHHIGDNPPRAGLLVFEGWLEMGSGDEPWWEGEWRELTSWEMTQLRCGHDPMAPPRKASTG